MGLSRNERRRKERRNQKNLRKVSFVNLDLVKYKIKNEPPKKLHSEPKCYASFFGECSVGISREHYISETILSQFENLKTAGIPWINKTSHYVQPQVLNTKCLCQFHNNFLSPLDDMAGEIFKYFGDFVGKNIHMTFSGNDFSLWCLKTLYGLLATKQYEWGGKIITPDHLDRKWLRILFQQQKFPDGMGLYLYTLPGDKIVFSKKIGISMGFSTDGQVLGFILEFYGVIFYFTILEKSKCFVLDHPKIEYLMYQPRVVQTDDNLKKITINWD